MEWKKINSIEDLPKDGRSFLAIWKGRICIAQYCIDTNKFFICFDPAEYEKSWCIEEDRINKFSHFIGPSYEEEVLGEEYGMES